MTSVRVAIAWLVLAASACGSVSPSASDGGGGKGGTPSMAGSGGNVDGGAGVGGGPGGGGGGGTGGGQTGGLGGPAGATFSDTFPEPFGLTMPLDGTINADVLPTFAWTVSARAAGYVVAISTSETFDAASTTMFPITTGTSATATVALKPGVIYHWHVTALSAIGLATTSTQTFWFSIPVAVGSTPYGVAVTSTGKVVVANAVAPGALTLVDLATFSTEAIPLPGRPGQVAVTPDGKTALAAQSSPNGIAVVDLAGKSVTGSVTPPCVATTYYGLAIKADGSAAVVPDFNGGCIKDVLDVIPLPGTAISKAIDLASSASAFGVALTPDGASALVTRGILGTSVKRVDLAGGAVTPIANTSSTFGVAITSDGKTAYVTSGQGETVKPIDLASNVVGAGIAFDSNQEVCNLALTPNGKVAVVVGDFQVGVLDLVAGKVTSTHAVAGRCVAVSPDGARAFVTGAGATGKLHVLELP